MDQVCRKSRVVITGFVLAALAAGCAKPATPDSTPAIQPLPVVTPKIQTIEEARALLQNGQKSDYEQALRTLAQSSDATIRRRALALHGLFLFDEKRFDEAAPALALAAGENREVAAHLKLRILEAETGRGNLRKAAETAAEIIALDGGSASTAAQLRLPSLHAQLRDVAATDAAFRIAQQIPIDELTESDFVAMANALAKAGRTDLATATRLRLLTDYTQGRFTEQTYALTKTEIAGLPAGAKLELAGKLSRANRYDQALDLFSMLPAGAAEVLPIRLRALFNSRNYEQILTETSGVVLTDPALILLRARAAWRAGKPEELLAGLARIETEFPASRETAEARVLRAKYYVTDVIDYEKSVSDLTKAIEAGVPGKDGENVWNLGWAYALWGRDAEALKTFERYINAYPDGDWKTNSLFWSAKILHRLDRLTERDARVAQILAEFPFSYYAYRAKELWPASNPQPATSNVFPDLDAELAKLEEPRLDTVRELLEIGLTRAAAREMKTLASQYASNPGIQFMLADVYVRAGEPFKANGVLQRQFRPFVRHGGASIPPRFWQILFPLPYWETIRGEAAQRGLDPYLIASIIRQESGFEPSTVSNAGAVGLMQIMPAEAPRIAAATALGNVSREDLFDPVKNIVIGVAEYSQKLAAMNGNPTLAIAAYNAGETAVQSWVARNPPKDRDVFIESIPFAETRLYVKTVTRNRFEYRRIYEGAH